MNNGHELKPSPERGLSLCSFSFFLGSQTCLPKDQTVAAPALTQARRPVQVSQPKPSCMRVRQVAIEAHIHMG